MGPRAETRLVEGERENFGLGHEILRPRQALRALLRIERANRRISVRETTCEHFVCPEAILKSVGTDDNRTCLAHGRSTCVRQSRRRLPGLLTCCCDKLMVHLHCSRSAFASDLRSLRLSLLGSRAGALRHWSLIADGVGRWRQLPTSSSLLVARGLVHAHPGGVPSPRSQ